MTPAAASYLAKVEAMGQRPLLSDPGARHRFYSSIRTQIVRQMNNAKKGKSTQFTPADLSALFNALSHLISELE